MVWRGFTASAYDTIRPPLKHEKADCGSALVQDFSLTHCVLAKAGLERRAVRVLALLSKGHNAVIDELANYCRVHTNARLYMVDRIITGVCLSVTILYGTLSCCAHARIGHGSPGAKQL